MGSQRECKAPDSYRLTKDSHPLSSSLSQEFHQFNYNKSKGIPMKVFLVLLARQGETATAETA